MQTGVLVLLAALATWTMPVSAEVQVPDLSEEYADQIMLNTIFVSNIELAGNTLLEPAEVDSAVADYVGRELRHEELLVARDALTRLYVSKGYINSGATLGDQEIKNGRVVMNAVQGKLAEIRVRGNKGLNTTFLESRLRNDLGEYLSITELETALRILQQRPMVRRVNAELQPGAERGTSILDLDVRENAPMTLTLGYDNHRAPSVGEDQGVLSFGHSSLTGRADYLLANYALTEGVDDFGVTYGIPLTRRDLTWEAYYSKGNSDITESGFDDLDITSEIETWGTRLYQPILRGLNHELVLTIGFEHTETESTLLGVPFSFSPGEDNGESELSLLRSSVEWTWRRTQDAISVYGAVNYGVGWLDPSDADDITDFSGATISDLPDSNFTSFLAQLNYARHLPWGGARALISITAQSADRPLLPSQQLAVGGASTVRGYRENQLVRDSGVIARAELRIPLFPRDSGQSRYGLTLAPFFDYGRAENEAVGLPGFEDPDAEDISSVGAGLLWNGWSPLFVEVYYGEDLEDRDNRGGSLQEDGWHIRAYLQWSFGGSR